MFLFLMTTQIKKLYKYFYATNTPQSCDLSFESCIVLQFFDLFLQCETIVEQHEDEVIEFFSHETENVKDKLCSKRTGMFLTQHA